MEDQPINGAEAPNPAILHEAAKQRFAAAYLRSLPQQNGGVVVNPVEMAVNLRYQQIITDLVLSCLMSNGMKAADWIDSLTAALDQVSATLETPKIAVPGRVMRPQ